MGILSGNPKDEPIHYGEVFSIWTYLFTTKACVAAYQTMLNHAGDKELRNLLEESISSCKEEIAEVETLLKENGVGLPPYSTGTTSCFLGRNPCWRKVSR